jgi:hypothetical protein
MMRPCATCARVCCVRLGSWSVACPPFPLCMSLCRVPCVRVPRFCSKHRPRRPVTHAQWIFLSRKFILRTARGRGSAPPPGHFAHPPQAVCVCVTGRRDVACGRARGTRRGRATVCVTGRRDVARERGVCVCVCVRCVRAHVRCWSCSPEGMGPAHIPACAPPGHSALRDNQPLQGTSPASSRPCPAISGERGHTAHGTGTCAAGTGDKRHSTVPVRAALDQTEIEASVAAVAGSWAGKGSVRDHT